MGWKEEWRLRKAWASSGGNMGESTVFPVKILIMNMIAFRQFFVLFHSTFPFQANSLEIMVLSACYQEQLPRFQEIVCLEKGIWRIIKNAGVIQKSFVSYCCVEVYKTHEIYTMQLRLPKVINVQWYRKSLWYSNYYL